MTKEENALQWSDPEADEHGDDTDAIQHFALEPDASPSAAIREQPSDVTTVSALFERQVAASPAVDALIGGDRTLDYETLNRKANRLAHLLIRRGIGPGAIVALGLPPGEALVVALLAVLKSGACYMPLDPSYPRDRLAFMVEDGAPRLVLANAATAEMFSAMCAAGSLLQVDGEQIVDALRDAPAANPTDRERQRPCSGDDPVYLVYTSGSTGRPKGVLGRQSALVNRLIWIGEACPFVPRERVLAKTSLNFIDGSTELLGALANGANVVLSRPEMVGDVERLAATIRTHAISRITVVPSLLAAFLDTCEPEDLRDCRTWVTSGEALSPALARRFCETLPDAVLFNFYGASEAAGDSLFAVCDGENGVPIGFPIRRTGVHVLDDRLMPVQTGRTGELYLSGAGLALGYLGQPALTAERFVASPFGPAGSVMYRTGDVVRRRDDGALDFIGRADHQVKIRGVRVEPGEVEVALANHPDIARCAVVARTSPAGEMQLVAYVVWAEGRDGDASALDSYLARSLPAAFVPSAFVPLSALPLMPNGKLDRSALPAPQDPSPATGRAPESDGERMVCEVFADILGLEHVGADDSFFRLGGHSLLAARAANRLRRLTGADIGLPDIFQHPTAAALAKRLDMRLATGPALTVRARPSVLPLSHAQRRLWIHNRLKREDASYHLPYAFRLRGALDIDALRRALGDVARRHESLRTVFPQDEEGIPHQRILPPGESDAAIAVQDADEAGLAPLLEAEAARPFDLTAELPLRASLFRLGPDDHVLLLTVHHIAMDGASVEPLWSDLTKAYAGRRRGHAPDWPPLPIQYADYALWQSEKLGDDVAGDSEVGRQLAYWRDALDGLPERIELPFEDARSTRQDWQGDVIPVSIDPALHARLLALASEMNASLFMVLQAGLAALLTRLGGGDDIPIGTPAEGRGDDTLDTLVGLFINMLVLRTDTSGDPSFRSLIERVRASDLAALAHQDIPFDRLVDALCPDRSAASHPLFQIVLALDLASRTDFRLDGLSSEPLAVKVAASKFDLSFDLREHRRGDHTAGGLDGYLEYRTDLFERDVARTLVDRFVAFLESAVGAPDTRLSDLDLVSADEWSMLRGLSEGPFVSVPDADQTIQACFADRVARQPDGIAVRSQGETLTYAELDRRASRVARHLAEAGVGPKSCVAILMERSIDLVVATLGVVKAGAAYVPLNVTDPPKRHALVAAETQARAVIVDRREQAPEIDAAKVLEFGSIEGTDDPFLVPGHPEQLACILYTSGSTGRPKGIGITHRGVICLALDDCWSDGSQERVLLHSPYAFDASTYELWTPLMRGTELVVAPPGLLDAQTLGTLIRDEGVTAICVTTRLFNLIAAERPATLAPVRSVLIGGEAASPAALRAAIAHCPKTRFVNGYGPAEGTTFVTHQTVRSVGDADRSVPIGLPRDNAWVRILDRRLKPIGVGMVGELYIGGCGVARGYLDRPDITAERFVADPFGPPGARIYRTGDLVRWRADGLLTFVGRADHQAKISGFRIEPGEVETAIAHCDGVGQCAVLIREDRPGDKRVVAYVVGVSGIAPDVGRLRGALADRLPVYMVPSAFVSLDRLPFTSNGKLDRGALPAPEIHGTSEGRGPRNEREATLCTLYSDILGVETVSIDDNFFALGGDSIMSIQLSSRARQMGLGFTPGDVFELKTVARLAGAASDVSDEPEEPDSTQLDLSATDLARVAELVGDDVESVWPLTALQEGLLFHALLDSDAARDVYTVQAVLQLAGQVDAGALRRAAEAVVERHAPLRASFRHRDLSRPVQVIHGRVKLPFAEIDLSGESDPQAALEQVLAEDRLQRFDPEEAPLLRMLLVRLAPERHALVMTNHHILLDGWSLPVLVEELMQLYAADGDTGALPRVTPFERYLGWLDRQDKEAARAAWRAALAGLEAPTRLMSAPGRSGGADDAGPPEHVELALDARTTAALEALGRDLDVTLNTVVQGAWGLLVGQLSGQDDVLFGTTVSGRPAELAGVESMVGLFINTVPVRVDLHGGESVAGLLKRLQERQAGLLAHQHLGLTEIQAAAGLGELFDTLLVFENYPASDETQDTGAGVRLAGFEVRDETHYPVSLMVVPGERLSLRLDTRGERVGEAQALAERLGHVLAEMAAAPERAVGALPILPQAEREEVLERWNRTQHAVPEGSLTQLIEARAAADPGATALVAGAERLSYRQLEARVNRLSHVLIGLGLGAEDIVGLALPRGIDMVVALLAILKSGAAYLPIDPDYPEARIGLMLADAKPVLVLSDTATAARLAGALQDSETLLLDDPALTDKLAVSPATPPDDSARRVPFDPRHPAYVIYTSGSTGTPKGVIVSHQGLVNLAASQIEQFGVGEQSKVLQFASLSFDAAISELAMALVAGGAAVLLPPEGFESPEQLSKLLHDRRVTHLTLPPSVLSLLAPDVLPAGCTLTTAGEALPSQELTRWISEHTVINAYGPTEVTVCGTMSGALSDSDLDAIPPIGAAIWNARAYVLDRFLQPVGIGQPGELYLAGIGLARGYLGRPDLTASRFVPDPFGGPGARMYRTGDLVCRRADGDLAFLGRTDDQVKIAGHRIEPQEIERVVADRPYVARCAVVARDDRGGAKRLVAYVAASEGQAISEDRLRRDCAARLPGYMVPAAFVLLESFPLLPNGKLDRDALPAPDRHTKGTVRSPRTAREAVLCRLFDEILALGGEVGADDSFFSLGGDSISSIRLVSRARAEGLEITPRDVFQHKTATGLAAVARTLEGDALQADVAAVRDGRVPLTPIMAWLRDLKGPSDHFCQTMLLTTPPGVDKAFLETALQAILDRHSMLRLRRPADWDLVVDPPDAHESAACLRPVVVPADSAFDFRTELAYELAEAVAWLSPNSGRMLRAVWFDFGPDRAGRLLIVVHHLAIDAVSWRILADDLRHAWDARNARRAIRVAPVATRFETWAAHLQADAQGQDRVQELDAWTAMLGDEESRLGFADLDPALDTVGAAGTVRRALDPELTHALLARLPDLYHCGVKEVLLAGFALAVRRWRELNGWGDGSAVLCDVEGHGRESADRFDLGRTVGWFTSLYPVRLDTGSGDWEEMLAGGAALSEAIKTVKEDLRAIADNGFGYGLLRYLNPEAGAVLAGYRVPEISFNYLGRTSSGAGAPWTPAPEGDGLAGGSELAMPLPHALALDAQVIDSDGRPGLVAEWTFASRLLRTEEVEALAGLWFDALEALARHADQPGAGGYTPSDFPYLHMAGTELDRVAELVGDDVESVWPLTALQEGLLFHALMDFEAARDVYTVQAVLLLEGRLDAGELRRAAEAVVERHAPLRASFRHRDLSRPVQVIHGRVKLPFAEIDLSGESDPQAALEQVLAEDRLQRFDPEEAPLLRMLLVRLAPERHALVMTNHHILLDGWSLPVLVEDLMQLYAADGDTGALPRVTPFERYLGWLDRQDKEAARAAWRAALTGLEAPTRLAGGPGDAGGDSGPPEHVELALDAETTEALEALGRELDVTLNTIVQGAWGLLVGQLSGQDDVLFGTTVSGRPAELAGVESMVGLFINTVPVRVDLHGGESVAALLQRLQERQAGLLAHQHLGLTEIQAEAGLGELFDTLLVFENYPASDGTPGAGSDVRLAGFEVRDETHYPVSLMVVPGERLSLRLDTRGERVGEAQALAERLGHVLAEMAAMPQRAVGALPILPQAERDEVLERWNRTQHAVPEGSLTSLIEARAAADPGATALVAGAERLSYRQLEARVNRLAHLLIGLGLGAEDIVGLALPRGIDMVVALLAILKSGAAYLPIDPDYPEARIGLMLADAKPLLVLSDTATAARLAGALHDSETLLLDDPALTDKLAVSPATPPDDSDRRTPFDPRHPAYVIYTSGSTGTPKGVLVSHQGLANFIHAVTEDVGLSPEDRLVSVTTIGFDIAGLELLGSLVVGARAILPDRSVRETDSLRELLWAEQATVMQATPSLWRALTAEGGLPALKVLVGGEALDPDLAAALQEVGPTINLYGPTETTIWSTRAWLEPNGASVVPIGSPIWNTRAYVLDGFLRPVGIGTPGELYIGGLGLARGYRGQPQLTADRFVADPFGGPGARMYRTGDLVCRRADGDLIFLGRNDDQIKIRGHRIEPAEIEQAIAGHPDVAQCRVVADKGPGNERRLIAYVVAKAGRAPATEDLQAHAEAVIPRFMVPSAFVTLDSLPLTPNGKLDRKALPVPELVGVRGRPPCTEEEKVLCGLFEEVLGTSKVSIDDSFFALGGHSLLATRLVSLLRTRLATGIRLQDVFSRPTVAGLLGASSTKAETDLFGVSLPLRPEGQSAPLFCIHPGYGLSWTYSGLAASIDADIPLYGLQARGFTGDDVLPDSLEQMASDYLRHIEGVQPEGPLRLLGWSFGGLVAYEIAVQLQESGREVELLALLDSYPVQQGEPLPDISLDGALRAFLDMIRYEPAPSDPQDVTFAEISDHLRKTDHPLAAISETDLHRMLSIARNNARLAHRFVPGRFEGDLIHFAAAASALSDPELIDAWSAPVLGTIRQYTIACDHHAMTTPTALMEIGRVLSGALDEAERQTVSHEKMNARSLWA